MQILELQSSPMCAIVLSCSKKLLYRAGLQGPKIYNP